MKSSIMFIGSILLCFASQSAMAGSDSVNLLKNGGFEGDWTVKDSFRARPAEWSVSSGFFGTYRVSDGAHSIPDNASGIKKPCTGKYAWEISHIKGVSGYVWGYQKISLKAGKYVLSGKVRTTYNDGKKYRVCVRLGKDIRVLDSVKANETDYQSFSVSFETDRPRVHEVGIGVWRSEPGYGPYSHWDDIKLTAIETREVSLVFDSDYDGWIDRFEKQIGTDPLRPDTDGDGIADSIDPQPLVSQGKPKVDYLKGQIQYTTIKNPTNFIWANLILRPHMKNRKRAEDILSKLQEWDINPSFGSFHKQPQKGTESDWAREIMLSNRAKGIPTDTWRCLHEPRTFKHILGFEKDKKIQPYRLDNPAVRELFAQYFVNVALHTPSEYFSQIDENNWCPEVYDWNRFCGYLIRKGYQPEDFAVETWDDLPRPDIRLPYPKDAIGRLLLAELQKYAEDVQLDYYKHMADTVHQAKSDIKINLGIFAPWNLSFGYYACVPFTTFHRVDNATRMEWDFYDWVYTGDYIRDEDMAAIEAGNQFLVDLIRKPIQMTFSPEFEEEGRDEGYYRLFMLSDMLSTDNITGVTFFYYGVKTAIGPFNMNNPRLKWVGEALGRVKTVYKLVHSMREKQRILIVVDDPIHNARGAKYDAKGNELPNKLFYRGMRYAKNWYFRSFKPIAAVGEDARFCVPRMLPGLDLSQYDVIVLDAEHIDDYPLSILKKWAKENSVRLLYQSYAAAFDEMGYPRKGKPLVQAKNALAMPGDLNRLSRVLKGVLKQRMHEVQTFSPLLRINVRGNDNGDRVVVVANFGREVKDFEFDLLSRHETVEAKLQTSSQVKLTNSGRTRVRGKIKPRDFEVLFFPAEE